jgi:chromosomal replication initiator protein
MSGDQMELGEDEQLFMLRRAWDNALHTLSGKICKVTFESYIRTAVPIGWDRETAIIGCPSPFAREWFKKYLNQIQNVLSGYLGTPVQINLQILPTPQDPENDGVRTGKRKESVSELTPRPKPFRRPNIDLSFISINERYRFDNFVIDRSNRLAHAGAMSVARNPGKEYNPLFIYGGCGLGKTHLLHAIGHAAKDKDPDVQVAFVDGEMFTQHYVSAIREHKVEELRRFYRQVDFWLVDDIQFIARGEQTKEEFFHTFNALYQTGKQIVITSDCSPRELKSMDERLRSRFGSGLIADINPPELETRVAILENKCMEENWEIPSDLLYHIASAIQSNMRALEGALTKLVACSSVLNLPLTTDLAQNILKDYFIDSDATSRAKTVPIDRILQTVSEKLNVSVSNIVSDKRNKEIATARQIVMFLARELTNASLIQIGAATGGKNHTTVQRSIAKVESELPHNSDLAQTITQIRTELTHRS